MMSLPVCPCHVTSCFATQIDLESVFALNPDVAPDEEMSQSPEAPLPPSNIAKTSRLPKVSPPDR